MGQLWVLRQIPFDEGHWDISIWNKDHSETFPGDFHVERGRRDQLLLLRLRRDTVKRLDEYRYEGKLEVSEVLIPEAPPESEFRAQGELRNPDGTPVAGAIVGVSDFLNRTAPSWTFSGPRGEFDLRYRSTECSRPAIAFVADGIGRWKPDLNDWKDATSCENAWSAARVLTMSDATKLTLNPVGATVDAVQAYWWHSSFGWRPFASLQPWIMLSNWNNKPIIKLESPGYLPAAKHLELPNVNTVKGEKPPASIVEAFAFDSGTVRELRTTSGGKPVPGATVDVEWIEDLSADKRVPLATYRTDAKGRLRLNGAHGQVVEVFVYAPGFEPCRAVWEPGQPLQLNLVPRDTRLVFAGLRPGYVARVRRADQPDSARTFRSDYHQPDEMKVTPGVYNIAIYGDTGQVRGYEQVTVSAGETRRLDLAIDQRPKLIVRYPDDGWSASVSDSTPMGGSVGWAAYSTSGTQFTVSDVAAVLESESSSESVFRLSRAGRFHVEVSRAGRDHTYWRMIDIAPGQTSTLDAPQAAATLQGSMRTYDGGIGFSHHGWAGPRLQLISDDPEGWSVTVYLPKRDGENTFTLRDLPSGDYHLYQHLIGKKVSYNGDKGQERSYTSPLDAWGGIPVKLSSSSVAKLADFIEYQYHDLPVVIQDEQGQPVRCGTLRIRDRMSDSWRQVAEGPTTLSNAAHPIPYPPAVRIQEGRATLPSVRPGWLELLVELDDGRVLPATVGEDAPNPLTIRLSPNGGVR